MRKLQVTFPLAAPTENNITVQENLAKLGGMSPFFPSVFKRKSNTSLGSTYQVLESPPKSTKPMCTGKSYYFEACGHTQSSYILICQRSESSKAKTDCDRLACTLVKDGVCPACMQIDAQIEKLRGELKGKERELNDAILLRGGAQARALLEVSNGANIVHGNGRELVVRSKEKTSSRMASYKGGKPEGGAVHTELRKLHHDILDITTAWWKERWNYQETLSAFQVKSLGEISYKDRITKCNKAREDLIKARFKLAEDMLITGHD